jgi:glutamyl/glutaminyl-tRNA synthetase
VPYRLRTRYAPTPSGYLHLGNAWSFVLTWLLARSRGGEIHLRIDDLDGARFRDEYLQDIFDSLDWLGLDWDTGPRDPAAFKAAHSQRLRMYRYRQALDALQAAGCVYACDCSREQVKRAAEAAGKATGVYPGTCRDLNREGSGGGPGSSLRYRLPPGPTRARDAEGGLFDLHPGRDLGDFVVRQKNGEASYQVASVADDEDAGINFVVRGLDLMPSTGGQIALASALGFTGFPRARFWHHGLVLGAGDEKLSKSAGAESLRELRARFPTPAPVYRFFGEALGLRGAGSARDLLPGFSPERAPTGPLYLSDFWRMADG